MDIIIIIMTMVVIPHEMLYYFENVTMAVLVRMLKIHSADDYCYSRPSNCFAI